MKIAELKKSAVINVLGWLLPALIFLVITPVMIDKLGVEGFGIVALIQIVTGYMSVLNFGFSEAIIKQVAEYRNKDLDHAMKVIWTGLILFIVFGVFGALLIYSLSDWLGLKILQVPDEQRIETALALKIASVIFLLQMIAEFYRGSAIGCSRFDIPNICRIIRISSSGILIIWVLQRGGGVVEIMMATLAGLIIGLVLNAVWMQRVLPMYFVSGGFKKIFSELFHFSKHVFFVRIAGMVSGKLSQFVLGITSSIGNVAFYEVPTRAAELGSVILNRILQVLYPGFASMDRNNELDRIRMIFFSVLSIQLIVITPFFIMVILEGPALLALWINEEFADHASIIISIIAITYFISSLTNMPVFAAMGFNMPGIVSKYSIIRMSITLVIVYPLVTEYGLVGAAWSLLISELQAFALIYETSRRLFGINVYKVLFRPIAIHLIIGTILYLLYELVYRHSVIYSPLAVLFVGALHFFLAIISNTTSKDDNRRIMKLLFVWR
ncbi:MAG: oligosaccharide flippase family protein [Candidatus Heimdallarchaeota archaeon]|nr:oligosaccharide flippase family protein [Candidatus Heimdallarchaeota archaeon]